MKKAMLALVACFMMTAATAQNEKPYHASTKQTVEQRTEEMVKTYKLDAKQQAALKKLNKKYDGKLDFPHNGSQAQRTGYEKTREKYGKELKKILTDAQYKQYTADRQKIKNEKAKYHQNKGGQLKRTADKG